MRECHSQHGPVPCLSIIQYTLVLCSELSQIGDCTYVSPPASKEHRKHICSCDMVWNRFEPGTYGTNHLAENGKRTYPLRQIPIHKKNGSMEADMRECHSQHGPVPCLSIIQYTLVLCSELSQIGDCTYVSPPASKEHRKHICSCDMVWNRFEPGTYGTNHLAENGKRTYPLRQIPIPKKEWFNGGRYA